MVGDVERFKATKIRDTSHLILCRFKADLMKNVSRDAGVAQLVER